MVDHLIDGLWNATWQGAIAVLIAFALLKFFRRASPAVQCWVWRIVAVKLLVSFLWIGSVDLPWLSPRTNSAAPALWFLDGTESTQSPAIQESVVQPAELQQLTATPAVATESLLSFLWHQLPYLLLGAWVMGVIWQLTRLAIGWQRVRKLRASARPIGDHPAYRILREEVVDLRLAHCPELLIATTDACPALLGAGKPAILLPEDSLREISDKELRLLLRHELAHLHRRDLMWNWLATAVQILFFFHPLVWLALREWRMSQELACDALALEGNIEHQATYAAMLLHVAVVQRPYPTLSTAAGVFESFATLKRRIESMSTYLPVSRLATRGLASIIAITAVLGICPWRLTAAPGLDSASVASAQEREESGQPRRRAGRLVALPESEQSVIANQHGASAKAGDFEVTVVETGKVAGLPTRVSSTYGLPLGNLLGGNSTTHKSEEVAASADSGTINGGMGMGGGLGRSIRFPGKPGYGVALHVAPLDETYEIVVKGEVIGKDGKGKKYKSIPSSGGSRIGTPEFEQLGPSLGYVYFLQNKLPKEFVTLEGELCITPVDRVEATFTESDLSEGSEIDTDHGVVRLESLEVTEDGIVATLVVPIRVDTEVPKYGPELEATMMRRMKDMMRHNGATDVKIFDDGGKFYRATSIEKNGSNERIVTDRSGKKLRRGSFNSSDVTVKSIPTSKVVVARFEPLAEGAEIAAVRLESTLGSTGKPETVPFKLENVKLD